MANIPSLARKEDGTPEHRTWIEYEIRCGVTRPATDKARGSVGFKRFMPDRGRTGKGIVQFWTDEGGLRTVDVEDIISVSRKKQT